MNTKKIVYISLFVAIGIVIPQAFHIIGGPTAGSIFLPMHIPVFIGAMLLGPMSGLLIGLISISIGMMLGMPPLPIAFFMMFELSVYGLVSGYLYHNKKINILVSLITSKTLGMATSLIVILIALRATSVALPPQFGTLSMFTIGLPGIVIQLILIPIIVNRLKGVFDYNEKYSLS